MGWVGWWGDDEDDDEMSFLLMILILQYFSRFGCWSYECDRQMCEVWRYLVEGVGDDGK